MSLIESYDLVEQAEKLVSKRQYKDASTLYKTAGEGFKNHIGETENPEINSALKLIAEQHLKRSVELSALESMKPSLKPINITSNITGASTSKSSPTDSISGSLASARGLPTLESLTIGNNNGNADDTSDSFARFQIQVYNLIKLPNLNTEINTPNLQDIKLSGKSIEELELENQTLKQLLSNYSENLQIYESFHKKVKLNLNNLLTTLKREVQTHEASKKEAYEKKIENYRRDNNRLQSQITKLKQRWDELVESAKKRRDDGQKDK